MHHQRDGAERGRRGKNLCSSNGEAGSLAERASPLTTFPRRVYLPGRVVRPNPFPSAIAFGLSTLRGTGRGSVLPKGRRLMTLDLMDQVALHCSGTTGTLRTVRRLAVLWRPRSHEGGWPSFQVSETVVICNCNLSDARA